jgi:hypothetical protein
MKKSLLFACALISCMATYSQAKTPLVNPGATFASSVRPAILNMKQLKGSTLYVNRQQLYANTFQNPSKRITYGDGSALNIHLIKSPSFANQSSQVTPTVLSSLNGSSNGMNCSTSTVVINATSTTFMNADYTQQASHIYPGAIYSFDHFFDGSYREETGSRNPMIISADLPNMNGSSYVTVTNPNMATIRDAVAQLYNRFSGTTGNGATQYQFYESTTNSDLNIKVSGGGSGYGFTFSGSYGTGSQSNHVYMTVDAIKTLYTINVVPPNNGFFVTSAQESNPNLMVIGSVTYGVRVLANLDFAFNSSSDAAAFGAKYSGYGVSANVDFNFISHDSSLNTTINGYIVGGPGNATISFDKNNLQTQLQNMLSGATYANARPVSFQLYDMAGDIIGSQSATDQFTSRLCVPADKPITLNSVLLTVATGNDGKDHDTHFTWTLLDNHNNQVAMYSNNQNNTEIPANSTNTWQLTMNGTPPFTQFQNAGGGHLHLHIDPNGNDTWWMNKITLNLTWSAATPVGPIIWSGSRSIAQDHKDFDLYFDGTFKAQ